ncbi:MAG: cysteine dioxygenase family protein [Actinomycetota bacterium]|jgi:predicted metal-dependent enzyme (double-stranded beta helix superfamily)|nr:cysteine dioxygenase family protein [Actinomycetota bacterium]
MDAGTMTLRAMNMNDLQEISELPTELALKRAASFLAHLVEDPTFIEAEIRPLLEEAKGTEGDWYVAHRYEGEDHSYSLQVFVWPPDTETKIHDHSCWGVYCCAVGSVLEERYERLDDGSRLDHAHLRKIWQLMRGSEGGASSVLPNDGGIHRVGNPGDSVAISVHLYGPRLREVDGRDFDPSCDYVCDRRED